VIKTILLYAGVIYLILGLFWFSREKDAHQALVDTCQNSRLAYWMATVFLILAWPYWIYKRIGLFLYYCRTMNRKR
jgi:Trk-type K+ transport system membrane component